MVLHLLTTYGYAVLFLLVGAESTGVPLPGEAALLTAAALAANGGLRIALVMAVAAAGAIIGDNAGYWIGRKGGLPLVRRYGRPLRLSDARLTRMHAFFERHGARTVFFGRFVALLRTWAALFAGVGEMHYPTFMAYNALGGVAWAALYGTLGYLFGRSLGAMEHWVQRTTWALVLVAALVVAGWWWRRRRRARP
jgi:membrane protein DedA with SNARE-associated domain